MRQTGDAENRDVIEVVDEEALARKRQLDLKRRELESRKSKSSLKNTNKKASELQAHKKKNEIDKTKTGWIGMVYQNRSYRSTDKTRAVLQAENGTAFHRAVMKAYFTNADTRRNFKENAKFYAKKGMQNDEQEATLISLAGWSGLWRIFQFAGTYPENSHFLQKAHTISHYLNPANYFLFSSILLDESVRDLAQVGLKPDESPGITRMSIHSMFLLISSLQRFVVSSACKPLVYMSRSPKLFLGLLSISAVILNMLVYYSENKTVEGFHQRMAERIFDKMIIPMLGGMKDDKYPMDINDDDKHKTIHLIQGFLVQYSAIILGSMGSQMPKKVEAIVRGVKIVASANEARFYNATRSSILAVRNSCRSIYTWLSKPFQRAPVLDLNLNAAIDDFLGPEDPQQQQQQPVVHIPMVQFPMNNHDNDHPDVDIQIEGQSDREDSDAESAITDDPNITSEDDAHMDENADANLDGIMSMFAEDDEPQEDTQTFRERANTWFSAFSGAGADNNNNTGRERAKSIGQWLGGLIFGSASDTDDAQVTTGAGLSEIPSTNLPVINDLPEPAVVQNQTMTQQVANEVYLGALADMYQLCAAINHPIPTATSDSSAALASSSSSSSSSTEVLTRYRTESMRKTIKHQHVQRTKQAYEKQQKK